MSGPTANPVNTWTHVAAHLRRPHHCGSTSTAPRSRAGATSGAIQTTTSPLWIGGNNPYGEYFQGLIDEVRVYNRSLTQPDIQADMNAPLPFAF